MIEASERAHLEGQQASAQRSYIAMQADEACYWLL